MNAVVRLNFIHVPAHLWGAPRDHTLDSLSPHVQIVNKTAAVQISDLAIDVIPKFKTWRSSKITFSCDATGYEGEQRG